MVRERTDRDQSIAEYPQTKSLKSGGKAVRRIRSSGASDGQIVARCGAEENWASRQLPDRAREFFVRYTVFGWTQEPKTTVEFDFNGKKYHPGPANNWKASVPEGMNRLSFAKTNRMPTSKGKLIYVRYFDDFPAVSMTSMWSDVGGTVQSRSDPKVFVVQTGTSVIERCVLMTTDPGDLVVDPTCGSGTTAYVSEQRGRRWITCDTSRVAITLAKQRLMTAEFDYYELAHSEEGVDSGFRYKTIPHVSLKSIANNPEIREGMSPEQIDVAISRYAEQETLYAQPYPDNSRVRVTGPFTVEAVPAPSVQSLDDIDIGRRQRRSRNRSAISVMPQRLCWTHRSLGKAPRCATPNGETNW